MLDLAFHHKEHRSDARAHALLEVTKGISIESGASNT